MRFASKRTVDTENSTEAGSSKLMVGLVDKRKPGMEFLGKRYKEDVLAPPGD